MGHAELEELGPIDYMVMEWPGPSPDASEVQPLLLDPHRRHRRHRHRGQQPRLAPPGRTLAAPGDLPVRAAGARARGPGGRLVFLTNSVLATLCVPEAGGFAQEQLVRPQRRQHRLEWPGGGVEFHPSHGAWVRVLGANGFVVEALHELYAPAGAPTHAYYDIATAQWASRWPVEDLWAARLRSPMGYEPSRPTSWTRWTASLREEAPSLR